MNEHPKKPYTIQDVAKRAQVSIKTVSRVINKEPSVRPATRERVEAIAKEMDYRPNLIAQSLKSDRSYLIGLFIEGIGSYVTDFISGVIGRCRDSGFHVMVEPWDPSEPDLGAKVATLVRQLRLEAAILLPAHCDNPVILDALTREGVPFVRIAPRLSRPDSPLVRCDDYVASQLMTAHLLKCGHRRIGFIKGLPDHSATEQRYLGFVDEMTRSGVEIDQELVVSGAFRFEEAYAGAASLLNLPNRPTAIFASNDDMAVAVMAVAQNLKIAVPQQLSVAGFDDTPVSRMMNPRLTTVRQPVQAIASTAADLIITHTPRRNGWPDLLPDRILEFEMIIRGSTGPVP